MKTVIISIFSLIVLTSCTDLVDQKHYYVDPKLKVFVDHFYKEATLHNVSLQDNNILITIGTIPTAANGNDVDGYADDNKIVINSALINSALGHSWNDDQDSLHVEYVIFHEMAHYLLHRKHLNYPNFTIMTYDSWFLGNYQTDKSDRKKLIDELFKNR